MVIKLLPEQVAKLWTVIRFSIAESFMPRERASNDILQRYLTSLLVGERQCWALLGDSKAIKGILISRVAVEGVTGERILSLDHIYAFEVLGDGVWQAGWDTLEKFAKNNNCGAVVSMTSNERVLQMARDFKFKSINYLVREV